MYNNKDFSSKVNSAMNWSLVTELLCRIISPVTNMILARILTPDCFGVMASVVMVISFAEIFVDSGFQKILIQKNFKSKEQEENYFSVAFWAGLVFSLFLWAGIIIFRNPLAKMLGSPELGHLFAVTGVVIPLYMIIGIQNCQLRKELQFRKLFYVRCGTAFIPLIVTVPLALLGFQYWALIIGNIVGVVFQSLGLLIAGRYRPKFYFSFYVLKRMLSTTLWTILDGIAVWLTAWVDSFLIANFMTQYYLGLYKNANSMVTSLFGIITAAIVPVIFPALSRLQNDSDKFKNLFLDMQHRLAMFLIPMGMGVFLYSDLATALLFGDQWAEAARVVGIIGLTTAFRTVFVSFYSELYRAKGKFRVPLCMQLADICLLIPSCVISVRHGFWALVYTRAFVKLPLILPEMIIAQKVGDIHVSDTVKKMFPVFFSTCVMAGFIFILQRLSQGMLWSFTCIFMAIIVYFSVLSFFPGERHYFSDFFSGIKKKKFKN